MIGDREMIDNQRLRTNIVGPELSIRQAMKLLNSGEAGAGRILFVVDPNGHLTGSLTDGDIRRAILNGQSLENTIDTIMFPKPRFVRSEDPMWREQARHHIVTEKLQAIPVLDQDSRVVDVVSWDTFLDAPPCRETPAEIISTPVVIMAGGKGTRLDPFTKILPKPLIPFGEKPIIERIMDGFHVYGFNRFYLCVNYKKEMIKMYFSESKQPYQIEFIEEEKYLGTAGGLGYLKHVLDESFFVCNCDVIVKKNFREVLAWHKEQKASATLLGYHEEYVVPYGNLEVKNGLLTAIREKPKYDLIINAGVYIMEPEVLRLVDKDSPLEMNVLIENILETGKISVYPIFDGWHDLGQWKDYNRSLLLLNQNGANKSDTVSR